MFFSSLFKMDHKTNDSSKKLVLEIPESFGALEYDVSRIALWFEKNWDPNINYEVISRNDNFYVDKGAIYQRNPHKLMLVLPITCNEFIFPENVESINTDALKFCNIKRVIIPKNYVNELPRLGGNFEEIVVYGEISSINIGAFANNDKLRSVVLPNCKIRIGEGAFKGCINLTQLVLPSYDNLNVVEIECMRTRPQYDKPRPFEDCINLCKLQAGNVLEEWSANTETLTITGSGVFEGSVFGRDFFVSPKKLIFGGGIKKINANMGPINYRGYRRYRSGCKDCLNSLIVQEGIEAIEMFAFAGCANLNKVVFPKSLKKIGKQAFFECKALAVPDISSISVGEKAFMGCANVPYSDADYENTIFCGQRNIFVNSAENNYYLNYEKAINLLSAFCKARISKYDAQIHQSKNCLFANWFYSGKNYHDGYEYERGASIEIKRISKDEYETISKITEQKVSRYGYLNSLRQVLQEHSEEFYVSEVKEDSDSCTMSICCKNLLGIAGYFEICEMHMDTM